MIRFEYKKIWSKTTVLALSALLIYSLIMTAVGYLKYEYTTITKYGNKVVGIGAFRALKDEAKDIEGVMDQKYLDNLVQMYNNSKEKQYKDLGMIKYQFPNYLINFAAYSERMNSNFLDLDFGFVRSENEFYKQYKNSVSNLIKMNNQRSWFRYTDSQMSIIRARANNIKTPFKVGYYEGLSRVITTYGEHYWLILIVLVFALCSIFSKDSGNGLDELTLASKHGRKKNMNARIIAGNIFALTVYGIFIATILIENGLVASLHGLGLSAQNIWQTCFYDINIGTGMLLMFAQGFLCILIVANLIMMVSIWVKYVRISALLSLASVFALGQLTQTVDTVRLQLNPLYFAKYLAVSNNFDIYYFIGNVIIPYSLVILVLTIIYLTIIRLITIGRYKRYAIH
jgi:hypothetical protein